MDTHGMRRRESSAPGVPALPLTAGLERRLGGCWARLAGQKCCSGQRPSEALVLGRLRGRVRKTGREVELVLVIQVSAWTRMLHSI